MTTPEKQWFSKEEASEYTGLAERTLRDYVSHGRLRAYRVGPRRIRFKVADLDALFTPVNPYAKGGERNE